MRCDVIVVGSGPAGTSAAIELVAAGRAVTMIEAGQPCGPTRATEPSAGWSNAAAVRRRSRNTSPKLRVPENAWMFEDFARVYDVEARGFELIGSLAHGGLSNVWGAGVAEWTDELDDWPADARSTREWYAPIAERIGVSGPDDDALTAHLSPTIALQPSVAVGPPSDLLVGRSRHRADATMLVGGVRHAVLTRPMKGRQACDSTGTCLTGCPIGAIYTSQVELDALATQDGFDLRSGTTVTRIGEEGAWAYVDITEDGAEWHRLYARRLLVAAGPPATTALALTMVDQSGAAEARMQSTPVIAWALMPLRSLPSRFAGGFAMGQGVHLGWPSSKPFRAGEAVYGGFFNAGALPLSEMTDRLPGLVARLGRPVLGQLWERLVLATAFLPGRLSRNRIRSEPRGHTAPPAIRIVGEMTAEARMAAQSLRGFYRREFARLGWLAIPGSFQVAPVGSDVHYGASLPMASRPSDDALATDTLGRLPLAKRIHFVDGSVLPTLSGKPHTLTVMANAARIASTVALYD